MNVNLNNRRDVPEVPAAAAIALSRILSAGNPEWRLWDWTQTALPRVTRSVIKAVRGIVSSVPTQEGVLGGSARPGGLESRGPAFPIVLTVLAMLAGCSAGSVSTARAPASSVAPRIVTSRLRDPSSSRPSPPTAAAKPARYSVLAADRKLWPHPVCTRDKSTFGLENCYEVKLEAVDAQIDHVADGIASREDQKGQNDIAAAERAWRNFRTADCISQGDYYEGGTAAGVLAGDCSVIDSQARLRTVQSQLVLQQHR